MRAQQHGLIRVIALLAALWMGMVPGARGQQASPFELEEGDRVVLLGNALVEAEQEHGYVELALTTRWPDRRITFRNIGWAGDTVYGEARGHFTNPPGPYEHLLDQVNAARPTVLVVGYGSNAAFDGIGGLQRFERGLHRLLDDLEAATGARIVLLSPAPHEADASPAPETAVRRQNENLQRVTEIIAETARTRGHRFVDLFSGLQALERLTEVPITTNGVHLSTAGYYYMAALVEEGLGLPPRGWSAVVNARTGRHAATGAAVQDLGLGRRGGTLQVRPSYVPVPPPQGLSPTAIPEAFRQKLAVEGLRRGRYRLSAAGEHDTVASAREWAEGVALRYGPGTGEAERLRRLILEKNRLYFHQYRPQNETYLLGFRAYEQGQHAAELDRFDDLIAEKEKEIGRLRAPKPQTYRLSPSPEP